MASGVRIRLKVSLIGALMVIRLLFAYVSMMFSGLNLNGIDGEINSVNLTGTRIVSYSDATY